MALLDSIRQNRHRFSIRLRRSSQHVDNTEAKGRTPRMRPKLGEIVEEAQQKHLTETDSPSESHIRTSVPSSVAALDVVHEGFVDQARTITQQAASGHAYSSTSIGGNARVIQGNPVFLTKIYGVRDEDTACDILLKSLTFPGMDARARNIAAPLPRTCGWLFEHPDFRSWTAPDQAETHRNFLWIKGKPGSGKSTLMRECMLWAEKTWTEELTLPYFFNARSAYSLDKSSLGLYQAFVYKLVTARYASSLKDFFYTNFESKISSGGREVSNWTQVELQNFLVAIVTKQLLPPCNMLIDALDEGDEEDVRQMIGYFEELGDRAAVSNVPLRICLSSRHFPFISIEKGLTIVLEAQQSHRADLQTYIDTKLRGAEQPEMAILKTQILAKSANVFLWIVLVIPMLNHIHDQGQGLQASLNKLAGIPRDLHDLFTQILSRHEEGLEECTALFRWLLFSLRPLRSRDLYTAVKVRFDSGTLPGDSVSDETVFKYLLNCSRGLVEITKQDRVQFIHETVRDYLLNTQDTTHRTKIARHSIDRDQFGSRLCNTLIGEDCLRVIHRGCTSADLSPGDLVDNESIEESWPLMRYAARWWHRHLCRYSSISSLEAADIIFELLTAKYAIFNKWRLICKQTDLPLDHRLDLQTLSVPLFYAVYYGIQSVVERLLDSGADVNAKDGWNTPLCIAGKGGYYDIAALLLNAGADVNGECPEGPPLVLAAKDGQIAMVNLFIKVGADVNACGPTYRRALWEASKLGHTEIVQALIRVGADSHAQERKLNGSPVLIAIEEGHPDILCILLEASNDFVVLLQRFGPFVNTLHFALSHKRYESAVILLGKTDLATRRSLYVSTFRHALDQGRHETIVTLIAVSKYVDINFSEVLTMALEIIWTATGLGYFSGEQADENEHRPRQRISRSEFDAITQSQATIPLYKPFKSPDFLDAALPTADLCARVFYKTEDFDD